jgi:hypothetical protein
VQVALRGDHDAADAKEVRIERGGEGGRPGPVEAGRAPGLALDRGEAGEHRLVGIGEVTQRQSHGAARLVAGVGGIRKRVGARAPRGPEVPRHRAVGGAAHRLQPERKPRLRIGKDEAEHALDDPVDEVVGIEPGAGRARERRADHDR